MSKSTLFSILVFAGLAAGVFLARSGPAQKGIREVNFATVETDSLDRIEIKGPNAVVLEKKDNRWRLDDGKPANQGFVKTLLSSFGLLVSKDLVTESKNRFANYEVDEAKGQHVIASSKGKTLVEFSVGKRATGGSYVLMKGAVFLVKAFYSYSIGHPKGQWYELAVFPGELGEASVATLGPKAAPYTLKKGEKDWAVDPASGATLPEGVRFDASAAARRVTALVKLEYREIVTEAVGEDQSGLGDPEQRFSFETGGKTYAVRVGKVSPKEKGLRYATLEGSEVVGLVRDSSIAELIKPVANLRDLRLMTLDPQTVSAFEVKTAAERLRLEKKEEGWSVASSSLKVPDDFVLDSSLVQARIASLGGVRALGVLDAAQAKAAMRGATTRVKVEFKDGSEASLVLGREVNHEGQKWTAVTGNLDAAVYGLSSWIKNNLSGGLLSFKKQAPAAGAPHGMGGMGGPMMDPAQLKKLPPEIREAIMKQQLQKARVQQAVQAAAKH